MSPLRSSFLITESSIKLNIVAENGYPWRTPDEIENGLEVRFYIFTLASVFWSVILINRTNLFGILKSCSICMGFYKGNISYLIFKNLLNDFFSGITVYQESQDSLSERHVRFSDNCWRSVRLSGMSLCVVWWILADIWEKRNAAVFWVG